MKKQFLTKLIGLALILCMLPLSSLSAFALMIDEMVPSNGAISNNETHDTNEDVILDNTENLLKPIYNEGIVLVKYTGEDENIFDNLDIKSAKALYAGSAWYSLELKDSANTKEMVQVLSDLGIFDCVDFDYIMKSDAVVEHVGIGNNPTYNHNQKKYFETHKVQQGWEYLDKQGINPGGSSDVIVAVIDTGVDYNHEDLKNNIWVNYGEIPNNGKDDDGNGYIDDVYGWDCVGNDKDPMDDNGHGTHVAGIIAAENNKVGGVGVAFNCKIMVIKAGNSSGYFNSSDIAEAIQYAYMNGASVINMSFGGSNISIAEEEALENAYNSCILVAAAGNDGACNNLACENPNCVVKKISYPAALPYVIGVMSVAHDGRNVSSFSNYDHYPYNNIEYEVYAVGESVYSCWPNNKYATLNGTSMAAPMVASIAALLRSYYSDREVYSTKYIQSQIVNTGTILPDGTHSLVNAHEALSKVPTPEVNLYDYYIDDSISISSKNNGNGVIDSGETVRLYISLHNRGGVASNVNVSIDTIRNNDPSLTDPYFTFVNPSIQLSDIGTYSVRESGDKYFEIVVSGDCPNDYLVNFNIRFTYKNGMDEKDTKVYTDDSKQKAQFNICNGYHLPQVITEDIRYKADKLYIVSQTTTIPTGVSVVFEEGCRIQFMNDLSGESTDPKIKVYGDLVFQGSQNNMIEIFTSSTTVYGEIWNQGSTYIEYIDATDIKVFDQWVPNSIYICNSILSSNFSKAYYEFDVMDSCYVYCKNGISRLDINYINDSYLAFPADQSINAVDKVRNTIFMTLPKIKSGSGAGEIYFNGGTQNGYFSNNAFMSLTDEKECLHELLLSKYGWNDDHYFSEGYRKYAETAIKNYITPEGVPSVDVHASLSDSSKLWPHIVSVEMFDKDGKTITTVGREEIKVRVTFNRPMDKNAGTFLTFGTIEPYGDYRIDGEYISDTVWEGTYTLKAQIENGQNFLKVNKACAAEDQTKTVFGEYQLHEFTIDTTVAMSMDLIANPTSKGVELTWVQDDYDTLMGYNIYRATSKEGSYTKINPSVILDAYSTFTDANVEAGKTYWYTFTVVLSDFTESKPAGNVSATAIDSIPPTITHTPITQGYLNNNLNISCTVSDNVQVASVTLYYRTVGSTEWHKLTMSKANNQYRATIYGSSLSVDGLEYYIVASDGLSDTYSGDANSPNKVSIKCATHDFTGDFFSNEEGHWRICSVCGEKGTVTAHTPGAAPTQTTPQTCTECGFVIQAALGHTHSYKNEYEKNEQQHWYECDCGAKIIIEDHVFDNACDPDCNKCGYEIERGHVYDNACDSKCNRCDEMRVTEHKFDDGVVTKEPTTTDKGEKTYTCTECGEKKYEDIDILPDDFDDSNNDESSGSVDTDSPEKDHSECEKNANGWDKFWNAIINFFRIIFGLPKICVCGDEI